MKKGVILAIAILIGGITIAKGQTHKPLTIKEQAAKLNTFFKQHPTEKAYLHLDKPYYAAGDTIYFKAYITNGEENILSPLSGVLYADIVNPQNKISQSIKLQINNGLAWGDFALPDSLASGNYRLRAYTKIMQGYGNDQFFDRVVPIMAIIKTIKKPISPTNHTTEMPDLQFFPEGGDLVAGVQSNVAFKAIASNGKGIDVSGIILNAKDSTITKFSSTHMGMGSVNITPAKGEHYHANIVYANGVKANVNLPTAKSVGIVVSVVNQPNMLSIKLTANGEFYQQNKQRLFNLLFYSGGKLTTYIDSLTNSELRYDIRKDKLGDGIAQITLTSADGEPLCERLVFINNNNRLTIDALTEKGVYNTREKITVKLHVQDKNWEPVSGNFSVSVIDKSKVLIDDNKQETILSYLLLTSCLKGYIEDPGYYFYNDDEKRKNDIDLVMLTHGYRRFKWKNIIDDDIPLNVTEPEKGLSISGIAKSFLGKAINNGTVTLIPINGGSMITAKTDKGGIFKFDNLAFYDTTRFVLNAINNKGNNNTQLTYQSIPPAPVTDVLHDDNGLADTAILQDYLQNSKSRHEDFLRYYGKGIQLKEVKIQGVKKREYRTQSLAGAGNADDVIEMKDIRTTGSMSDVLTGRVGGLTFVKHLGSAIPYLTMNKMLDRPMLVVIDGMARSNRSDIDNINPIDVERVEVLKYASTAIYGVEGAGGVLIITTKQGVGLDPANVISRGVLPLKIVGFYKARQFYAPRYDQENNSYKHADLRSTIFWLPQIATDVNGDASFDYFNADNKGTYQIIIEGITNEGMAGAAKFTYEVK
ncbi:hypothetical protein FFF34_004700 [Inquilinus sp. KBS0705]|nr:hypothetical protein FFF34_004700 [Inquilinus sp. KBS0705]